MKLIDLVGKKFNKLTVKSRASSTRSGMTMWVCVCDCGNETKVGAKHLKEGKQKSCGCHRLRKGPNHELWAGVGDMSMSWFHHHIIRETKQFRRPKLPVTITKEYLWNLYLKQDRKCALTGIKLILVNGIENTASVDRIDNSLGYVEGNVQFLHKDINMMKRSYHQTYFIELCKLVSKMN